MLTPGAIIDNRFKIVKPLGDGGFGEAYLATQLGFDRNVVLKLLHDEAVSDPEATRRFEREAKLLSMLQHKNIAMFLGHGVWNDRHFTALEHVPGKTLLSLLTESRLCSAKLTKSIAESLLSALSYAHTRGVIHRDIKPSNILIDEETGCIKLIDFGLASIHLDTQHLTQPGVAIGTVLYMPPEQCGGLVADARSDLYSLGCVLYQCLTGTPPFFSSESIAIMFMHVNRMAPPLIAQKAQDAPLAEFIATLLEKDPLRRFQSADEALAVVQEIQLTESPEFAVNDSFDPVDTLSKTLRNATAISSAALNTAIIAIIILGALGISYGYQALTELALAPNIHDFAAGKTGVELERAIEGRLNAIKQAFPSVQKRDPGTRASLESRLERELSDLQSYSSDRGMPDLSHKIELEAALLPWLDREKHRAIVRRAIDACKTRSNAPDFPTEAAFIVTTLSAADDVSLENELRALYALLLEHLEAKHEYAQELSIKKQFLTHLKKAYLTDPYTVSAMIDIAQTMKHCKPKSNSERTEILHQAAAIVSTNQEITTATKATLMMQIAKALVDAGDARIALDYYERAWNMYFGYNAQLPKSVELLLGKANCELMLGQVSRAAIDEEAAEKALSESHSTSGIDIVSSSLSYDFYSTYLDLNRSQDAAAFAQRMAERAHLLNLPQVEKFWANPPRRAHTSIAQEATKSLK